MLLTEIPGEARKTSSNTISRANYLIVKPHLFSRDNARLSKGLNCALKILLVKRDMTDKANCITSTTVCNNSIL